MTPARRLSAIAESLAAEAKGMTKKLSGVRVVIAVYTDKDAAVRHVIESDDPSMWASVAGRLAGVSEEILGRRRGEPK